jgi:DNA polymerase-3 subunit delta
MLTAMPSPDVLGTVTLVAGTAEFLAEREVADVRAATLAADPDSDFTELDGSQLIPGALAELTSPSLFSSVRCLVIRGIQELTDEAQEQLLAYARDPASDVAMVLIHSGGQKGKGLVDKLKKHASVRTVECAAPKPWERASFVKNEARRAGGQLDTDAADFLAEAVGEDLRALSGAVHQLVHDFEGRRVTTELVRRYFDGRAEVKGFAIADAAIEGRLPKALEQLRWARGNRLDTVLIVGAVAAGLRSLARLQSAPSGMRDADLAREIGAPPFKIKAMRAQLRSWEPAGLVRAMHSVAAADVEIKGGSVDVDYALERMILRVVRARSSR